MPDDILLSRAAVRKLIGAGSADAALLYLYLCANRPAKEAGKALGMTDDRLRRAGFCPVPQGSLAAIPFAACGLFV